MESRNDCCLNQPALLFGDGHYTGKNYVQEVSVVSYNVCQFLKEVREHIPCHNTNERELVHNAKCFNTMNTNNIFPSLNMQVNIMCK